MKRALLIASALVLAPVLASAQESIGIPGTFLLPNYDRVSVGQREAIEAGSFVARTDDAVACWYNPAGLASAVQTKVSASGNAYEAVALELFSQRVKTGSMRVAPIGGFIGAVIADPVFTSSRYRAGVSVTNAMAWEPGSIQFVPQLDTPGGISIVNSASLRRTEIGASLGYRASDAVRVGVTGAFSFLSMDQHQDIMLRTEAPDPGATVRRTFSTSGSAYHLYARGGGQWDLTPRITLGLTLQSPGLGFGGSTRLWYSAGAYDGNGFQDVLFADKEAEFDYRLPFNTAFGAAYKFERGAIEVNARYYGAVDTHEIFESDGSGSRTTVDSTGATTTTGVTLAPQPNSWRDVVNVSAGGNLRLSDRYQLHAGFASDRSPVEDPGQSIFRQVDLLTFSTGVSFVISRISGAVGLAYSDGESDALTAVTDPDGNSLATTLKVRSFRISYALSFAFGG